MEDAPAFSSLFVFLFLPDRHFLVMCGFFFLIALGSPLLNHRFGLADLLQALGPPGNFLRQRLVVNGFIIGLLSLFHQLRYLLAKLIFELSGPLPAHCLVFAGIGINLAAINRYLPDFYKIHLVGNLQDLNKQGAQWL